MQALLLLLRTFEHVSGQVPKETTQEPDAIADVSDAQNTSTGEVEAEEAQVQGHSGQQIKTFIKITK